MCERNLGKRLLLRIQFPASEASCLIWLINISTPKISVCVGGCQVLCS